MPGIELFKRGLTPLRQHPWFSLMGITSVAVALTLIALFALISLNVQRAVGDWSRDFQIVIYLDPSPTDTLARQWQTALGSMAETEEVSYVSSAEALKRFSTRLGNDASLISGIGDDVLPASFKLKLRPEFRQRDAVKLFVSRVVQKHEWRDIHYGSEWIEQFDAVRRLIRITGTIFGLFLFLSAFLIVTTTIRLILLTRKSEIEILRLLGASPLYIGLPFLLEGGILGMIGGGIALILVYFFYQIGLQQGLLSLLQLLGVDRIVFLPPLWQMVLIIGGVALGFFASFVAMRRISKV
jgi:cell division transport system permease protein